MFEDLDLRIELQPIISQLLQMTRSNSMGTPHDIKSDAALALSANGFFFQSRVWPGIMTASTVALSLEMADGEHVFKHDLAMIDTHHLSRLHAEHCFDLYIYYSAFTISQH